LSEKFEIPSFDENTISLRKPKKRMEMFTSVTVDRLCNNFFENIN